MLKKFQEIAGVFRDKTAIFTKNGSITYKELDEKTDRLASYLIKAGIKQNEPVGVFINQDENLIFSIFAILKVQATYLPLDNEYPDRRLSSILNDSELKLIITDTNFKNRVDALNNSRNGNLDILNISDFNYETYITIESPVDQKNYNRIFSVFYTSGSTGIPKGVIQGENEIYALLLGYIKALEINEKDNIALLTSYSHVVSVIDIFSALLTGATLSILNIKDSTQNTKIPEFIESNKITVYHSVPTLFRFFVNQSTDKDLSSVRLVILGGEKVLKRDFEYFGKHFNERCKFVNLFGSSEVIIISYCETEYNSKLYDNVIPIGICFPGISINLVNHTNHTDCHEGELNVISEFIAPGYLNNPEETHSKFRINSNNMKTFISGDQVILKNEQLLYLGRTDNFIKIHGQRIELGEIEQLVFALSDEIKNCKVVIKDQNMYVFYTLHNSSPITDDDIKQFLKDFLLPVHVPRHYIKLKKFPETSSGKVDILMLKESILERQDNQTKNQITMNDIEAKLLELWKIALGDTNIGIDDNFFDSGGDSLRLSWLHLKIQEVYPNVLSMQHLFDYGSVREISKIIMEKADQQTIHKVENNDYEF